MITPLDIENKKFSKQMVNGYNVTASHGGVITHDGQRLKIKYVSKEYDGVSQNIILYIAQIEEADT